MSEQLYSGNSEVHQNDDIESGYEAICKGAAEIGAVSSWSRKGVNTAACEMMDFAKKQDDSLLDDDYFLSRLSDRIEEYEEKVRTQRQQEQMSSGYMSIADQFASDTETHMRVSVDAWTATFRPKEVVPQFTIESQDGYSGLDMIGRWAKKFIPEQTVDATIARIQTKIDDLNRQKDEEKESGEGSSFLYYYGRPHIAFTRGRDNELRVFFGVHYMKRYEGEPYRIRPEGLNVNATPEMIAELQGVVARKKAKIVPFDVDPMPLSAEELRAAAMEARRSMQQTKLDNLRYLTPEFMTLTRQDFINAGVLVPYQDEIIEEMSRDEKRRIDGIIRDVEALNAAYVTIETNDSAHATYHKATYNYEHTRESKWGKELITQYGIDHEGNAAALRKKPNAPQGWEPVVSMHIFGEKYQKRAAELIIQLANKNLQKENIEQAHALIKNRKHTARVN